MMGIVVGDDEGEEDEEEVLARGSPRRCMTGVHTRNSAHSVGGSLVAVEKNHFRGGKCAASAAHHHLPISVTSTCRENEVLWGF